MCYSGGKGHHGPRAYAFAGCGPLPGKMNYFLEQMKNFMPYDLLEVDDEYHITMPLPGFDVENINVSIKGKIILIEAKKPSLESESKENERYTHKKETLVTWSTFLWDRDIEVKIQVEVEVDEENVKAK